MHMSRMSAQERVRLEATARPIAKAYVKRGIEERDLPTAQSIMLILRDVLLRGCFASNGVSDGLRLSPRQQWLVRVAWCLRSVGDQTIVALLLARLTRQQKTASASWETIAADIVKNCDGCRRAAAARVKTGEGVVRCAEHDALTGDVAAAQYERALPAFVREIEARSIREDYATQSEVSERYRPKQRSEWNSASDLPPAA